MTSPIFDMLRQELGLSHLNTDRVNLTDGKPVYASPFRSGEAAAAILALQGLMLDVLRAQKGLASQTIRVDYRAAAASTHAVAFQRQNGHNWSYNDPDYPTTDFYRTADDRWIFLHGGYPRLRDGILNVLDVPNNRQRIAQAVLGWQSNQLENVLTGAGLCGVIARTYAEWLRHPQGRAVGREPLIRLVRLAGSEPVSRQWGLRQVLHPVRVLDFTHVIAGPTCTRGLAQMGADVLHVSSPERPRILPFDVDTNHGKRNTYLDLTRSEDRLKASRLIGETDVFVQSYRPGALGRYGLSANEMVRLNPRLIMVNMNCYGHTGPWCNNPGFEQLAQSTTGMAWKQGEGQRPELGPTYPNDYLTGYLATLGILMALEHQGREGGAWQVDVSLCKTATWLQTFSDVPSWQQAVPSSGKWLSECMVKETGPFGELEYFNTALHLDKTPLHFMSHAMPLGAHPPCWRPY